MNDKDLSNLGAKLLSDKQSLNSLNQEIAEHFYPERSDFTVRKYLGTEFAANTSTSYPMTCRRDLANQIGTMLRPTAKRWFHPRLKFTEDNENDIDVREQLDNMGETMRRAMYDPHSMFARATKEGDNDYATFGQCAISVELNSDRDALLYRAWHLRDMAWQENESGGLSFIVREWRPTIDTLFRTFREDDLHPDFVAKRKKNPFDSVKLYHIVCESHLRDKGTAAPRWSIYWDCEHNQLVSDEPLWGKHYVIPRWAVVGSQYGYSPATVLALPDGRLLQSMTYTMLEVGEKAANPPLVATKDVVRSDVSIFAGGITWVDNDYDERLGDALRPLNQDYKGINYGLEMLQDTRAMLQKAFYLDTLTMPQRSPEMTAYEVGQRVQEYIRNALPLFEPMEQEYNAGLCEETFGILLRNGGFGSPSDWPKMMRGQDVDFRFESPLHDIIEQQDAQTWVDAKALIADAMAIDPDAAFLLDYKTALRQALIASGTPAAWINDEDEVEAAANAAAEMAQQQQQLQDAKVASEAARNLSQVDLG